MIKSEGGFLNQIRPELLMNYNDYLDVLRFKEEIEEAITMNNSFAYYKIPIAEQFEFERKKAWITLIYQIFKVASRIPLKKKNN